MESGINILLRLIKWAKEQRLENINDDMYIGARNDIIDQFLFEAKRLLTQIKK